MADKLCIFCSHCFLDPGSPGYSEYTPGYNANITCNQNLFEHKSFDEFRDERDFRDLIKKARTCNSYDPVEE